MFYTPECHQYCLDSMANGNVVMNPYVLTNIRPAHRNMTIDGVGGKKITVTQIGDHKLFGLCW